MDLGKKIAYYRKNRNITQEALAKQLGISNQAVSKWETDQSYPDIELLPRIADIFGISLDELFERDSDGKQEMEAVSASEDILVMNETMLKKAKERDTITMAKLSSNLVSLPWADDEMFRAVLFVGHRLLMEKELSEQERNVCKEITFRYEGPARDVLSCFDVSCGDVTGGVTASGCVKCGDVGECITAGGSVECGDVGQTVTAGGSVGCGDVGQTVTAGGSVECGDINGDVAAGNYIICGDVEGNVTAGSHVESGDVQGDVSAEGNVNCGDIGGEVRVSGMLDCGDIGGCVYKN